MFLSNLLSDPASAIKSLLLMLPGMLLALSIHEAAHGYIAGKCGDPTARMMGRVTLNPTRHLDPVGFAMMFLIGFGWAKPVPVNPNNFRNYRRDDIKVSLAGITANLLLFFICALLVMSIFTIALGSVPHYDNPMNIPSSTEYAVYEYGGQSRLLTPSGYIALDSAFKYAILGGMNSFFITPVLGSTVSIIVEMLIYCMLINISLAVFNLLPIPPLDGYHVLNDIVLRKQDLFVKQKTARIAMNALLVLIVIGWVKPEWDILSIVITAVRSFLCNSFASLFRIIVQAVGII